MAKASRNLLDGKKRQASLLGSTLTSLTLNSENDSTTSSEEDESVTESDSSHEEETVEESSQKLDEENNSKSYGKCTDGNAKKKQSVESGKEKPKVRMKTLTIDGQLVYFCVICDKIFTKKKDKINHQLAHSNKTLISCPECGKDFFHESSLAHHIKSHDGEQLHFCDFCPKMFAQSHQLKAHVLTHSNPTEIKCNICSKKFENTSDLNIHHRNKIKEEMSVLWCDMCKLYCCRTHCVDMKTERIHAFRCSACNELFCTLKKLKLHAKRYAHKFHQPNTAVEMLTLLSDVNEKDDDLKSDLLATSSFSTSHSLKHQLGNSDQDDGPRSKKPKASAVVNSKHPVMKKLSETETDETSKLDLQYSKKLCKSQRKPYCKKCNRSFKETSDLISHKLSAHSVSYGSICQACGEEFSSRAALKQHKCKVRPFKPRFYDGCDTKSGEEPDLTSKKPSEMLECHICTKTFPSHDKLQNHLRLHTNIKSFQCYLCQRIFVTKHYLQHHLQVHIKDGSIAKGDLKRIEDGASDHEIKKDDNRTDIKMGRTMGLKPIKFRLGKENIHSFSDDSASSFMTRESDKSDACQLSSASLHSFKVSMARERRRQKKKKSLSKSLLCKALAKKRKFSENSPSVEKSVVFVDQLPEDNSVNNFVVELNGARSEIDQETTIFVELTLAKLVPKDVSVLYSSIGIDKENAIPPSCFNDSISNSECKNSELCNTVDGHHPDKDPNNVLSNKVMVLDLEMGDIGAESFSSFFDKTLEPIEKSVNDQQVVPLSSLASSEMLVQGIGVSVNNSKSFDFNCHSQKETSPLQPLHSLHLLTAKFGCGNEQSSENSVSACDKKFGSMNSIRHDVKQNKPAPGKTCRDIAASWKFNKTTSNMDERFNKAESKLSKENVNCSGTHFKRDSAFKRITKKASKQEIAYQNNDMISSNIKKEFASPEQQHVANSFAFRSPIKSSQPLPPIFRSNSLQSSSFSTHCLPSQTIKCERSHEQENHTNHPHYSSSSNHSNEVKGNIPGSFLTPNVQSTPVSSRPHNAFHFDTDNPALRDMNLMEMVCSIQTQTTPTTTVTEPENLFQVAVSSSTQDFKREIDCESTVSLSRNIKTELTYPSHVDGDCSRFFGSSVSSSRTFAFNAPLPSPSVNLNPSVNLANPNFDHVVNPICASAFRPSFHQPDWSLQQAPLPAPFPPQGTHLINNTFPLLQIPTVNTDFSQNRCTYNADNLIFGHPGNFGLTNPHVPSTANFPSLHPLHFGNPAAAVFHPNITPLPLPPPPPPPIPPTMMPNAGIFYLPF